jgi:hypothetical protein
VDFDTDRGAPLAQESAANLSHFLGLYANFVMCDEVCRVGVESPV